MEGRNFDIAVVLEKIGEEENQIKFLIQDFVFINQFDEGYAEVLDSAYNGTVYPIIFTDDMSHRFYLFPNILEAFKEAYSADDVLLTDTTLELYNNFAGHELHFTVNDENKLVTKLVFNPELFGQNFCDDGDAEELENKEANELISENSSLKRDSDAIDELNEYINSIDRIKFQDKIKRSIIAQDDIVDKIATHILYNQKILANSKNEDAIKEEKKHILLAGKSGTGKSEIIRQIANNLKVPVLVENATTLTDEGYVGRSVSEIYNSLIAIANGNVPLAERGIIIIDEIDKKAGLDNNKGVSTTAVQDALLPLLDSKDSVKVTISDAFGKREIDFDTTKITVVLMGAFTSIKDKAQKNIGFNKQLSETKKAEYSIDEFVKAGMKIEFMGRIGTRLRTNDLSVDDLMNILINSDISPLNTKKKLYDEIGIKVSCDDDSVREMAIKAYNEGTNARGLYYAFEQFDYELKAAYVDGDAEELRIEKGKVRKIGKKR